MAASNATTLRVALVSEIFVGDGAGERLRGVLAEARAQGAELAVLPELPLDSWSPATPEPREEDAEPPEGPRHQRLAEAARAVGIGLVGGAIVRDPATGRRHNTALVFDAGGSLVATYRKLHLPDEAGFHEPCHYEPGDDAPRVVLSFGLPLGVQICSDANRPEGSYLLAAQGAEALLVPRATEPSTFGRWRLVMQATAMVSAAYVLSVNRPRPEFGVPLGGPSVAISPDGEVLAETTDRVALVTLDRDVVAAARRRYPGYLPFRAGLYAEGWRQVEEAGEG